MTARHRASYGSRGQRTAGAIGSGAGALLLLVAAFLVGPLPAQAAPASGADPMLRLAQLTPDLPDVELRVSPVSNPRKGAVTATLHYGTLSGYQTVRPGDYVITMRPAGSTAPAAVSRTLSVQSGTTYTVASVAHKKTPNDLTVFTDDLTPPQPGRARVRVINAAPPAPQLDVRDANNQPVALALAVGAASPYQDVDPGDMRWTITPAGGGGTPLTFSVPPNQVSSVVLTSENGVPRASVVADASGPAVVPPGPVHAGYGGTAGPAPGAAVGSGVLAVLAAVAAGVAVRLARRTG